MNTIQITNPESNDVVTYTEVEVLHISQKNAHLKQNLEDANTMLNKQRQRISDICGNVHEIFSSHYESGDSTVTISVDDINELLEYIGADTLKKLWSATVFITLSINGIEASTKEEAEEIIDNNIEVNFTDDGDANIDEIDVRDISEE
jgi:hypothetical protein